ncbi:unnamed protein product [Prunus armeniaca]
MMDAEWEDQNELARRSIKQHLTDGVLYNAIKDTANQSWEKLEELFVSRSLSNKIFFKEELHYLKMEDGANMMEHVNASNMCIADFQRMDEHFHTTVMFGKGALKYEAVMQDILMHDRMLQLSEDSSKGEGLVAKTGRRGCSYKSRGKSRKCGNSIP